jgi:manganese transport system ATP-binding protein
MARYPRLGLFGRPRRVDREAIDGAMLRLEITDLAGRQIHHLSGGQRQRVFVAQGLAQDAPILLLDEPLTGLDVRSRAIITSVLDDEHAAGRTVITTTHNFDDAARCELVLLLATRFVAFGTPDEVFTETHLRTAFGGRFVRIGDTMVLDDPHHHD